MGQKTKIDWCDSTWNPVTGCLHGCEYCYARRIAERFGGYPTDTQIHELECAQIVSHRNDEGEWNREYTCAYPFSFSPTLHRYRLDDPARWTKPRTIFVCSMADLFGKWVPDKWIEEVFEACDKAAQHRYLFLTKNPGRYAHLGDLLPLHRHPPHVAEMWFGHSYTGIGDYRPMPISPIRQRFVSIEPLLHDLSEQDMMVVAAFNDWIIVGAETGNNPGKVVPDKEWVMELLDYSRQTGIPIFMKESLREIMGDDFQQEFPWERSRKDG